MPVECDKTCQTLPCAPESSGIILLNLKRKLQFRGRVYYQAVHPEVLLYALNWLVASNELSKRITIDIDELDRNLTNLRNTSISECTIKTTAKPVNEQNILLLDMNKSTNQKIRNLLLMKLAKTQSRMNKRRK